MGCAFVFASQNLQEGRLRSLFFKGVLCGHEELVEQLFEAVAAAGDAERALYLREHDLIAQLYSPDALTAVRAFCTSMIITVQMYECNAT